LGGWITDNFSWRWIFFINVPVGLLSMFLTTKFVEDPPHLKRIDLKQGFNMDFIGLGLITLGIGSLQIVLDKGEREGWFDSRFIVTLIVVGALALALAVFWELHHRHPLVDLRLLGERNFAFANVLMFMLGFALFGSTVLLPLFLQTLMGYPATTAGLVLSPGGFLTMMSMPLVGYLLTKYQPKWLIAYGLAVVSASLFYMSRFNLFIDYKTAVIARCIQASGLGFLFVPINSAAYAFVPKEKNNNASGLINLARNLGGSFGIALMSTRLSRAAQFHQNILSAHMTPFDFEYLNRIHQMTQGMIQHGMNSFQADVLAHARIYQQLIRQSMMLAYVDDFRFLAMAILCVYPLLFFLKKSATQKGTAPVH
jgi:DHA2 family multidrug resistance protein